MGGSMSLQPLFARVLLKRERVKKVGSIYLPSMAEEKYAALKCDVVAVGPNCDETVKVGDTVIIGKYAGTWIDEDGNPVPDGDFYICNDEDILAKVSNE